MGKYRVSYVKSAFTIDGEIVYGYAVLVDLGYTKIRLKAKPEIIAELFNLPISQVKSMEADKPCAVGYASFENPVPSTYIDETVTPSKK